MADKTDEDSDEPKEPILPSGKPETETKPARKRTKRGPRAPKLEVEDLGYEPCQTCRFFHNETTMQDEINWGQCWRYPPRTVMKTEDNGDQVPEPATQMVVLPYGCGEHKPN